MKRFRPAVWMVVDSAGIGEMPDAMEWGDAGSDTIGYAVEIEKPHLLVLQGFGLGNIHKAEQTRG